MQIFSQFIERNQKIFQDIDSNHLFSFIHLISGLSLPLVNLFCIHMTFHGHCYVYSVFNLVHQYLRYLLKTKQTVLTVNCVNS